MRIARATAAPRVAFAGERPILISPPSLRDFGLLFNFLEDAVEPPDDAPDGWTPALDDRGSLEQLDTELGMAVLLHVAMRRDQPEARLADAMALVGEMEAHERARVREVVLARRKPAPAADTSHWKPPGAASPGTPLDRVNFGKLMERADLAGFPPDVVSGWTLDQLENKLEGGEPDEADRARDGEPLSERDVAAWMRRMMDPDERARAAAVREAAGEDVEVLTPATATAPGAGGRSPGVVPEGLPELLPGLRRTGAGDGPAGAGGGEDGSSTS